MKLILPLFIVVLLCGCKNPGGSSLTSPEAITGDVRDLVVVGLDVYPAASPDVAIARDVICSAAQTNLNATAIVADLTKLGITNSNSKLIIDGVLLVWNRITPYLSNTNIQAYSQAVCLGMQEGTGTGPMARRSAKKLPPHLK